MNQMISKVAREMAGEIYDPVTVIKGYVDLLERKLKDGKIEPEALEPILREIQANCRRAAGIAESLQDLSLEPIPDKLVFCSTKQIVDRCLNLFSERIKKFGIKLQIHHDDLTRQYWCHHLQVVQILACLLNEAIERVKGRTVRGIGVITSYRLNDTQPLAVIRVQDSGSHKLVVPVIELCDSILASMGGEVELVDSSFGACLELRFPIEIK